MHAQIKKLDLAKDALTQWNAFTPDERSFWINFFRLKQFRPENLQTFKQYCHSYSYHLNNETIARTIFCAVIEILKYNRSNQMHRIFFGNSGGLDSAVICGLLSLAARVSNEINIPLDIVSCGLPIYSNEDHDLRASETSRAFGVRHITVHGLNTIFDAFTETLLPLAKNNSFNENELRRGLGNVKARIRMIVNFFCTTKPGSYVMSTDNLSELYMAFWTLMGDVGTFGPIQYILKGLELPAIAIALDVPEQTINAKPTDGLGIHKSLDEQEGGDVDAFKGVSYPHLDAIICRAVAAGLDLKKTLPVHVDASLIDSPKATQEVVNYLIAQMVSTSSVWKRTKGSIGSSIPREQLGLPSLPTIIEYL